MPVLHIFFGSVPLFRMSIKTNKWPVCLSVFVTVSDCLAGWLFYSFLLSVSLNHLSDVPVFPFLRLYLSLFLSHAPSCARPFSVSVAFCLFFSLFSSPLHCLCRLPSLPHYVPVSLLLSLSLFSLSVALTLSLFIYKNALKTLNSCAVSTYYQGACWGNIISWSWWLVSSLHLCSYPFSSTPFPDLKKVRKLPTWFGSIVDLKSDQPKRFLVVLPLSLCVLPDPPPTPPATLRHTHTHTHICLPPYYIHTRLFLPP